MAGGLIRAKTEAVVGSEAVESIKKFNFTKSFIGAIQVPRTYHIYK